MRATLLQDGSLALMSQTEARVVRPGHRAYQELMRLYQQHATIALASTHAPAGYTHERPLAIAGHNFYGGQFIPAEVVAEATPAEKRELKQPGPEARGKAEHAPPPGFGGHPWMGGTPEHGTVYHVPTEHIHRDPERFQFKADTDSKGVTDKYAGVKYDPEFGGVLSVWKDPADGQTYVVNGHHRLELAERSGISHMPARYIKAKDAAEARAVGALSNIAGEKASPADAKKFLREAAVAPEDLEKRGIVFKQGSLFGDDEDAPPTGKKAKDAARAKTAGDREAADAGAAGSALRGGAGARGDGAGELPTPTGERERREDEPDGLTQEGRANDPMTAYGEYVRDLNARLKAEDTEGFFAPETAAKAGVKPFAPAPISSKDEPKSKGHVAFIGKHEYYRGADNRLYKATLATKINAKTGNRTGNLTTEAEMGKAQAKAAIAPEGGTQAPPASSSASPADVADAPSADDFDAFAKRYRAAYKEMLKYSPGQVGASHFAEQMARMADEHPEWVERIEAEEEQRATKPAAVTLPDDWQESLQKLRTAAGLVGLEPGTPDDQLADAVNAKIGKGHPQYKPKQSATAGSDASPLQAGDAAAPGAGDLSPPAGTAVSPHIALAEHVAARLRDGETIEAKELFETADKHHGGTRAEGKYGPSEAYDSLEAGFNIALIEKTDPRADLDEAISQAEELADDVSKLPTQTNRSGNKEGFQQFSTPPHYAYAINWLANLNDNDTVLEPSAGTGSLAVHAANTGARVIVNERDPQRAAFLAHQFGTANVHQENAEQIGAILPARGVHPTAVVMNPPFSQTAGRLGDKKVLMTGANHITAALQAMEPGGRLVAIVGGGTRRGDVTKKTGMSMDSPTYRKWFADLAANGYTLRANVGVEGNEYKKYGTHFGTRTLIIDKVPPAEDAKPIVGEAEDIPDLMRMLEGVRDDRPQHRNTPGRAPSEQAGARLPAATATVAEPESNAATRPAGGMAGQPPGHGVQWQEQLPGRPEDGGAPTDSAAASGIGGAAGERLRDTPGGTGGEPGPGVGSPGGPPEPTPAVDAGMPKRRRGGKAVGGQPGKQPRSAIAGLRPAEPVTFLPTDASQDRQGERSGDEPVSNADLGQSLYEPYRPQLLRVDGAVVHDTPLVESAAMAAVTPPVPTYRPHLSPDVVQKKTVEMTMPDGSKQKRQIGLSEHAVEAVVYAGQAHEQFLEPDNEGVVHRRGFFIGDGTGSGKGREIAGVIMDNTNQGRKKHVWISQSQDLIGAATRDWADMGGAPGDVFGFDKVRDAATPPNEGIAFVTYAELRGGPKDKSLPRNVDNLADWLGPDFDGVISFDESHNLGNATDSDGGFGTAGASQQALAGIKLQKLCPKARVLYVSATGATEVKNLAYAERLGIWGRGTPFANKKEFIDQMERGGVGAMEAVAQSLKATGSYTARSIGYGDGTGREGGKVDFQPVIHHLTEEQRFNYDACCDAWQNVLANVDKAIEITTGGGKASGRARAASMSQFWGQQQRFYNQFMTSMQTPSVIAEMEKDKAEGRAPVVALVNTMKASLDRSLAKKGPDDDLDDLDVSPKEILTSYLKKSFPTERMEEYEDADGNIQMRPVMTTKIGDDGLPVMGEDGKPLMVAVEDPEAVALRDEMLENVELLRIPHAPLDMILNHFGHDKVAEVTGRDLRIAPNDEGKPVIEKRSKHTNGAERSSFMAGKKFAAVVSGAGLTGFDYHADKGVENQGRRRMYLLQPGWRADGAVQAFGRVNRTNQTTFPIYSTVQIAELQGQKRFISTIARRLEQLGALTKGQQQTGGSGVFSAADNLESVQAKQAMDHFFDDLGSGRVEGLDHRDVMKQLGLYSEVQAAKGKDAPQAPNSMGQFLNRLLAMRIDTQNKVFDAFDQYLQQTVERAMQDGSIDTGVENFKAHSIAKTSDEAVYREPHSGAEVRHLTTIAKQKAAKRDWNANEQGELPLKFVRNNQNGNIWAVYKALDWTNPATGSVIPQFRLRGVSGSKLVPQNDLIPWQKKYEDVERDDAKADWEQQYRDTPEHTESEEHFLVGALLPIWDRIPGQKPKIYRIRTEDGQTVVGRHVPAKLVPTMLKSLGVDPVTRTKSGQHDPANIHSNLESGRIQATLANGWKLKPVRVQNERRIELTGPGGFHVKEIQADGVIKEKIGSDTRFFVPVGPAGADVLKRITKSRPIAEVTSTDGQPVSLSSQDPAVSTDVRAEALRALRAMFPLSYYEEEPAP